MAKRKYDADDRRILRVLKMQQDDLDKLAGQTADQQEALSKMNERLNEFKRRAQALAEDEGVDIPEEHHIPTPTHRERKRMKLDEVPDWEELETRAHHSGVSSHVAIEDLLSSEEIARTEAQVKQINDEYTHRTALTERDLAFLTIATSIQTARWAMIPRLINKAGKSGKVLAALSPSAMAMLEAKPKGKKDLTVIDEANKEFQEEAEWEAEEIHEGHKSWEEILKAKDKMPVKTFNNDAMNWIFGLINAITGTQTNSNFKSVDENGKPVKTPAVFAEAFRSIQEDPRRLSAAVYALYAQEKAAHGETTDVLKPFTETFAPQMNSELYQSQVQQLASIRELTLVGQQAAIPLIINMAIGLLHGLMYNPELDGPHEFFDARTRKILLISNLIASSSNVALAAGTEAWMKLDLGGLLVTATRAIQDVSYLTTLEDEFMRKHLDQAIIKELQDIDSHFINLPVPYSPTH